jgi:hypothetical protein
MRYITTILAFSFLALFVLKADSCQGTGDAPQQQEEPQPGDEGQGP